MGRGGVRPRPRRGPPGAPLGRVFGLSLVPRHGARVLRGRRNGPAHERALRLRQGRPGGTARRRRALHGRRRRHDRSRRLADDGLPDAGRPSLLRRHLLPAGAQARDAELRPGAAGGGRGVPCPAARARAAGRRARGRDPAGQRASAVRGAAHERPAERRRSVARPKLRPPGGRLRARAQVPGCIHDRAPAPPARRERRRRRARHGPADPRPHGRRRHVRPARRRLPPLLGGRPLARAPLREDALRQRAPRLGLPPRLGRDRRGALPRRDRGDAGLRPPRAAPARGAGSPRRRTRTRTASRA